MPRPRFALILAAPGLLAVAACNQSPETSGATSATEYTTPPTDAATANSLPRAPGPDPMASATVNGSTNGMTTPTGDMASGANGGTSSAMDKGSGSPASGTGTTATGTGTSGTTTPPQ